MTGMLYELAVVEDHGSYYNVTNVTRNTFDNLVDKEEKLIKLSYSSHRLIEEALLKGKTVHIQKHRSASEVLPGEFEILDISETDPVEAARKSAIIRIRMLVTPELSKISGFALYGFMILNNDLANAGYFITNENREEKYLEILETGDEKLIQKLEDYLNYKDEIESVSHLERKFVQFRKDVRNSTTVEEVKSTESIFLEKFYATF